MSILVTGAAGFIGYHIYKKLLEFELEVIGFDNLNDYYDVSLKKDRIHDLEEKSSKSKGKFHFFKGDLTNKENLKSVFNSELFHKSDRLNSRISIVINLAAQAGVRYSIENPYTYIQSNIVGFCNLIEECKENKISHFIYASSSSVYGGNKKLPFEETDNVDHPISI